MLFGFHLNFEIGSSFHSSVVEALKLCARVVASEDHLGGFIADSFAELVELRVVLEII